MTLGGPGSENLTTVRSCASETEDSDRIATEGQALRRHRANSVQTEVLHARNSARGAEFLTSNTYPTPTVGILK